MAADTETQIRNVDFDTLEPSAAKDLIGILRKDSDALANSGDPQHADMTSLMEQLYQTAYPDDRPVAGVAEADEDHAPSDFERIAADVLKPVEDPDDVSFGRLNLTDDIEYSTETEIAAKQWSTDAGLAQPEIDSFINAINEDLRRTDAQREKTARDTTQVLVERWGDDYHTNLDAIVGYAESVGGQELLNFLVGSGLGGDFRFLETALTKARNAGF